MTTDSKRLRALLKRGGLSQNQAARELEVSRRMMSHYCAGTFPVPRMVWLALEHVIQLRETAQPSGSR